MSYADKNSFPYICQFIKNNHCPYIVKILQCSTQKCQQLQKSQKIHSKHFQLVKFNNNMEKQYFQTKKQQIYVYFEKGGQNLEKQFQKYLRQNTSIKRLFLFFIEAGINSLLFLHSYGIQHNDIKLQNFILTLDILSQNQKAILIDFNISSVMTQSIKKFSMNWLPLEYQFQYKQDEKEKMISISYQPSTLRLTLDLSQQTMINFRHPLLIGKADVYQFAWSCLRIMTKDQVKKKYKKYLTEEKNPKVYQNWKSNKQKQIKFSKKQIENIINSYYQDLLFQFKKQKLTLSFEQLIDLNNQSNVKINQTQQKIINLFAKALFPIKQVRIAFNQFAFEFSKLINFTIEDEQAQLDFKKRQILTNKLIRSIYLVFDYLNQSIDEGKQFKKQQQQKKICEQIQQDCFMYIFQLQKNSPNFYREQEKQKQIQYKYLVSQNITELDIRYLRLFQQIQYFISIYPLINFKFIFQKLWSITYTKIYLTEDQKKLKKLKKQ